VVRDALFQAYRKLDTFDKCPLAPWLFRIAHNRCIDFLRRHEVRKEAETAAMVSDRVIPVDPPRRALGRAVEHLVLTRLFDVPTCKIYTLTERRNSLTP